MKLRFMEYGAGVLAFTTAFALAGAAHAQDTAAPPPPPPNPPAAGGDVGVQTGGETHANAGMTLPGAAPARPAATGDSDHDGVIGTFGIGLLGTTFFPVGCANGGEPGCTSPIAGGPGGGVPIGTAPVPAPIIGARYWINEMIGIDAGIGLGIFSLGGSAPGGNVNRPNYNAFALHGGVPLALASSGHFAFEVIPEMNIGFSNWSLDVTGAPSQSGSGFHFDVGARAGAEIQFGFIGIPKLALQGTVGLSFFTESTKFDPGAGGAYKLSQTGISTTVQGNPWDIFRASIAALYYF